MRYAFRLTILLLLVAFFIWYAYLGIQHWKMKPVRDLEAAIWKNDAEHVRQIYKRAVSIKKWDGLFKNGHTPLMRAIENQRFEAAKALIDCGVDVNGKGKNINTPLIHAINRSYDEIACYLIEHGADVNPTVQRVEPALPLAVRNGTFGAAESLIMHGTDINAKGAGGLTALHYSIFYNPSLIPFLIDNGADINQKTDFGQTALHFASWKNNKEVLLLLIRKGADVNAEDDNGLTPLHYHRDDSEVLEIFLKNGADPNLRCDMTKDWIYFKGETGGLEMGILGLSEAKTKDRKGWTALHCCCAKGNRKGAEILLKYDAKPDIKDDAGRTPRDIAVIEDKKHMLDLFDEVALRE